MARKQTERERRFGKLLRTDTKVLEEMAEDVRIILRSRKPKPAHRTTKPQPAQPVAVPA